MRRRSPAYVLFFGLLATLVAGRHQTFPGPGGAPPERWVVLFRERSFTLDGYRRAIREHRGAAAIAALVADLDRRAAADQEPFAATVQEYGGRVLQHWWLINGCAVELPRGQRERLQGAANVLRIEPDSAPTPGDGDGEGDRAPGPVSAPADARNHGVAGAHALGVDGRGEGLAILDTGQDVDCGGTGRPHPIYAGASGADSRLVRNVQLGAMPADDCIGHGTAVAAIAAGARWNGPGAEAGHAPAATIAGYAIAERPDGATTDSTLISAWQQVARDRAAYHLVAANNSYGGSPDPTAPVQQALDSAAYNADLLVTVCAYNTGRAGSAHSQSACNGLAVGAVTADEHAVCGYSARGPLYGDERRTYPDLCAVANAIGPSPDCDRSAGPRHGTSFAAPQVLGAAALVRQAAPTASALETKAILLAATLDLAGTDGGADRNATGTGLLRDDCAVATALDPSLHGTVTAVDLAPLRVPFHATHGEPTAIAIAWHRTDFGCPDWADVDLAVFDGDEVVAAAQTPRNLYEHLRFVPAHSGTFTAELRPRALPHGALEVAFAVAHQPAAPQVAGYRTLGAAIAGTTAAAPLQQHNGDASADDVRRDVLQLSATEWLFEFTAPASGAEVQGFAALLALVDGPADVTTALYLGSARGPRQLPSAYATMRVGRQPGWSATHFDQATRIAPGEPYYVAVQAPGTARFVLLLADGEPVHAYYRWPCSGIFVDGGRAPAAFRVFGNGVTPREPQLSNVDLPDLGHCCTVELWQLPPSVPVLLATALTSTSARPRIDLGTTLGPVAVRGDGIDALLPAVADAHGTALLAVRIPADPCLRGQRFLQRAFTVAPDAAGVALLATPTGAGRIGDAP